MSQARRFKTKYLDGAINMSIVKFKKCLLKAKRRVNKYIQSPTEGEFKIYFKDRSFLSYSCQFKHGYVL